MQFLCCFLLVLVALYSVNHAFVRTRGILGFVSLGLVR